MIRTLKHEYCLFFFLIIILRHGSSENYDEFGISDELHLICQRTSLTFFSKKDHRMVPRPFSFSFLYILDRWSSPLNGFTLVILGALNSLLFGVSQGSVLKAVPIMVYMYKLLLGWSVVSLGLIPHLPMCTCSVSTARKIKDGLEVQILGSDVVYHLNNVLQYFCICIY